VDAEMTEDKVEQLEKFNKFSEWLLSDLEKVLFKATANFLFAQAIFNYIEIMGSFLLPAGNCTERFNSFFRRLGTGYSSFLDNGENVYGELRCGLTHEYLPRRRRFSIANPKKRMTDEEILRVSSYGIKLEDNTWKIRNARLFLDFKKAVTKYIEELKVDPPKDLSDKFYERCSKINLENFS
jgi:hypothetical protein